METHRVVRAERFELVDTGGSVRALLHTLPDGSVGLDLKDGDGHLCACLGVLPDGRGLAVYDEHGTIRATLSVSLGACPALGLYDKKGEVRAALSLFPDGAPLLALRDQHGRDIFQEP